MICAVAQGCRLCRGAQGGGGAATLGEGCGDKFWPLCFVHRRVAADGAAWGGGSNTPPSSAHSATPHHILTWRPRVGGRG